MKSEIRIATDSAGDIVSMLMNERWDGKSPAGTVSSPPSQILCNKSPITMKQKGGGAQVGKKRRRMESGGMSQLSHFGDRPVAPLPHCSGSRLLLRFALCIGGVVEVVGRKGRRRH